MRESFVRAGPPAVLLSDFLVTVPIHAVSTISLNERYHVPQVAPGHRVALGTHDDSFLLNGLLVGPERYAQKVALESLAEGAMLNGFVNTSAPPGLTLMSDLTMRLDLFVTSLDFRVEASRPGVIQVSVQLVHVPRPNPINGLIDRVRVDISALDALF